MKMVSSLMPLILLYLMVSLCRIEGRFLSLSKPDTHDYAAYARWLVSQNSWGVLKNVVSFSDGLPGRGAGIPYFYLTTLDPTAANALKDERSSLAISEFPIGTCGNTDPENPTCAKITLTGKLKLVDGESEEVEFAQNALFTKHPEMIGWPKDHNFQVFKLEIEDIFLINWFGGRKPLTVEQYLSWKKNKLAFSSQVRTHPLGAFLYFMRMYEMQMSSV